MFESLAIRIAVAVAATAAVSVPVAIGLVPLSEAPLRTPPEPPHEQVAPRGDATVRADHDAGEVRTDGNVGVGIGDDGAWLHMEGRDEAGATGSADVSMTDEGMRLELDSDAPDGTGSAGVALTDEGMQLWFDVDQSP